MLEIALSLENFLNLYFSCSSAQMFACQSDGGVSAVYPTVFAILESHSFAENQPTISWIPIY